MFSDNILKNLSSFRISSEQHSTDPYFSWPTSALYTESSELLGIYRGMSEEERELSESLKESVVRNQIVEKRTNGNRESFFLNRAMDDETLDRLEEIVYNKTADKNGISFNGQYTFDSKQMPVKALMNLPGLPRGSRLEFRVVLPQMTLEKGSWEQRSEIKPKNLEAAASLEPIFTSGTNFSVAAG